MAVADSNSKSVDIHATIPPELSVQDYVEARAQEMVAMSRASKTVIGNNQPLQKLPRHMRRRAASHNVKRLPRKMHNWAKREYDKSGTPTQNKRPSRKHRRRPKNLLEEYNRRKRQFVWLETHIWHAKRFHMSEQWGYKIPLHPNDKGARAAYRASAKYCLLQDYSYYCCIEIGGPQQDIVEALSHLCSRDTGLTFGAKAYLDGMREGELVAYYYDQYPYGAMGPVKYMWRYKDQPTDDNTALWLLLHPAMYKQFMKELRIVFDSTISVILDDEYEMDCMEKASNEQEEDRNRLTEIKIFKKQMTNQYKAKYRRLILQRKAEKRDKRKVDKPKSYVGELKDPKVLETENFTSGAVTVKSLKDSVCRFHLSGPLTNEVLLETLKVTSVHTETDKNNESHDKYAGGDMETNPDGSQDCKHQEPWWYGCYGNQAQKDIHMKQEYFWNAVRATESPSELSPHCILGLTVRDPRKSLPHKKAMVQYENKGHRSSANLSDIPHNVSWSPLWEEAVRTDVKKSKLPDAQINEQRSKLLVPGKELPVSVDESRIPLILIQNPGHQVLAASTPDSGSPCGLGYSAGWDVILPGGWAMPFLVSLVYRGARVAGLKETHSLAVEAGVYSFPNNFPDTVAGRDWELFNFMELEAKHERIPPAKRPNYDKLGVVAPFHYPWQQLVTEWSRFVEDGNSQASNSAQPQRHETVITHEGQTTETTTESKESHTPDELCEFHVCRDKSSLRKLQNSLSGKLQVVVVPDGMTPPAKVSRTSESMSSVHEHSTMSNIAESLSDLQCLVPVRITMIRRGHSEPFSMICLPTSEDMMKLSTDKSYGGPLEHVHVDIKTKEERAIKSKAKKNEQKYLCEPPLRKPPKIKTVVKSCSRQIMGYIKDGNFSYARGCGFGLGFVTCRSLLNLAKLEKPKLTKSPVVLVRIPKSLQYRYAKLTIAS